MQRWSIKDLYLDESYYSGGQPEPVSLAEAKTHLLIESSFTDDDAYILALITQCRGAIEDFCDISIQNKLATLTLTLLTNAKPNRRDPDQGFWQPVGSIGNGDWINLPRGPVKAVMSVTGFNLSTMTVMQLNSDYYLQGLQQKQIMFANNGLASVLIVYQVGWLNTYGQAIIPPNLKLAILNEIAFRYENRGDNVNRYAQQNIGISEGSQYLAFPYRQTFL